MKLIVTFVPAVAEIAQLVEHQLPKLRAAGSNPVFRSKGDRMTQVIRFFSTRAAPGKLVCRGDCKGPITL